MNGIWDILVQINIFFQSLGNWLITPMHWITMLGDAEFYLLAMPALYWCVDSWLGLRIGMMLMLSNTLGTSLKFLFHTPRPFWVSQVVQPVVEETSFGMPSGHALNAMALWGYGGIKLKKTWVKVICWSLVFLIGFSRIVMGVHFINDMLLGWLAGAVLLFVFIKLENRYAQEIKLWTSNKKLVWIFGSTIAMILLPLIFWMINTNYQVFAGWLDNILFHFPEFEFNPYSLEGIFTIAGTWLGLVLGLFIMDQKKIKFDTKGPYWQRFIRYIVGVFGLLVFYLGLKLIFPDGGSIIALVFRFIRYTLIGGWVTFGAPFMFIKLKLTDHQA